MIPADLSAMLDSQFLDVKKWDYTVQSSYAFLEFTLKEFDDALTKAVVGNVARAKCVKGQWVSSIMQFYFQRFLHLLSTPLALVHL